MNQITTHHMDDTINPFDAYTVGRQSFSDYERVSQPWLCWIPSIFDSHNYYLQETESYEDNFRHFAEECDNLQVWEWESNVIEVLFMHSFQKGFQILTSVDDAFGGFTEGMLQLLREDFPKTPIMTYGLQSSNMPVKEVSNI